MLKGIKGLPVKREACVIITFLALLSLPLAALTEKEQDKSSEALNNSKTEASSRNREIIADSMIYNGYDGNYEGNLNPALQFTDVDVFGSGNCFNLLFAGIFLSLDYTISQKAEIPFNITIHTDGTAKLGSDFTFYEKGEETDWTLKGPGCNLAVILSRDMDCGFSIKTTQLMNFSDYDSNDTAFVSPENTATYTEIWICHIPINPMKFHQNLLFL